MEHIFLWKRKEIKAIGKLESDWNHARSHGEDDFLERRDRKMPVLRLRNNLCNPELGVAVKLDNPVYDHGRQHGHRRLCIYKRIVALQNRYNK